MARAWAGEGQLSAKELAEARAAGFSAEDYAVEIEVFPDVWPVLMLLQACETQWRVASGFGGVLWIGLDYTAVQIVMRHKVAPADRRGMFEDLQAMEAHALPVLNRS